MVQLNIHPEKAWCCFAADNIRKFLSMAALSTIDEHHARMIAEVTVVGRGKYGATIVTFEIKPGFQEQVRTWMKEMSIPRDVARDIANDTFTTITKALGREKWKNLTRVRKTEHGQTRQTERA